MAGRGDRQNPGHGEAGSSPRVALHIFPPFRRRVSGPWLRRVAEAALEREQGPESAIPGAAARGVEVVVADDGTIQELNRRYRGLDEVTDVLAFSPFHSGPYEGTNPVWEASAPVSFPMPAAEEEPLGVVIVAWGQAKRQAAQAGHPLRRELAGLVVHGILHLLGHDHAAPGEERLMQAQEQATLETLDWGPGAGRSA